MLRQGGLEMKNKIIWIFLGFAIAAAGCRGLDYQWQVSYEKEGIRGCIGGTIR